ncbi:MAG TPA: ATP-binding protein, partial [Solirubrobacterales bacterium]|nr:ATP-binding protein [Solirubrobacterales bacterium]
LEALGRHHSLEAALAELVDNAIDAKATHVLIRFVKAEERLCRLLVVDDGVGMTEEEIDVAMTVGGDREYAGDEIGRFGLGLKAASFSQARSVTVVSRARSADPVGRRWQETKAKRDYTCEIVEPGFAELQLSEDRGLPTARSGTLIRWDEVKGFPLVKHQGTVERFLQDTLAKLRRHLGLVFHRILEAGKLQILIGVEEDDEDLGDLRVPPLNPFGYTRTGAAHWPKELRSGEGGENLRLVCHIWPPRSNLEEFRLDGDLVHRQGFYCYFRDRLVQAGGWNGIRHTDKQLNLARVVVELDPDAGSLLMLNPEKSGVESGPAFGPAIAAAKADDGTTFDQFVDAAREAFKEGNRRRRERRQIIPPGAGLPSKVRRAFARELPFKNEDPIEIRWAHFDDDDFFEIDREGGVLWLNRRYRRSLSGGRNGSLNDLPVLKSLLYLLMEDIYSGQNLGPRDKDNVEIWQAILTTAAEEETR